MVMSVTWCFAINSWTVAPFERACCADVIFLVNSLRPGMIGGSPSRRRFRASKWRAHRDNPMRSTGVRHSLHRPSALRLSLVARFSSRCCTQIGYVPPFGFSATGRSHCTHSPVASRFAYLVGFSLAFTPQKPRPWEGYGAALTQSRMPIASALRRVYPRLYPGPVLRAEPPSERLAPRVGRRYIPLCCRF